MGRKNCSASQSRHGTVSITHYQHVGNTDGKDFVIRSDAILQNSFKYGTKLWSKCIVLMRVHRAHRRVRANVATRQWLEEAQRRGRSVCGCEPKIYGILTRNAIKCQDYTETWGNNKILTRNRNISVYNTVCDIRGITVSSRIYVSKTRILQ